MLRAFELKYRSDRELLTGVKVLAGQEREATAQLIAHLAEIDNRRLFLSEGCSSLFKYCTDVLHLSESAAYNRIEVARVARKFPVVLEKLAEGSIHLSALRTLAPCLTAENHLALLEAAKHKSKEEVERIAAAVRPRPDVPSVIRKLPEPGGSEPPTSAGESDLFLANSGQTPPLGSGPVELVGVVAPDSPAPPRQSTVAALSPGRYKIEFTADAETHEAFRQLQELLRHQIPNGDPAKIFKRALLLLRDRVLEFHHLHAYALGGSSTTDNIALRCRAHNAHESRLLFVRNGKKLTCSRTSLESLMRSGDDASNPTHAVDR